MISAINKVTYDFVSHVNWDPRHHSRYAIMEVLNMLGKQGVVNRLMNCVNFMLYETNHEGLETREVFFSSDRTEWKRNWYLKCEQFNYLRNILCVI